MADSLDTILRRTSRSFYLSLRVLPPALRQPFSVAYLLARAADTIADTEAAPPGNRRQWLSRFAEVIESPSQAPAFARAVGLELHAPKKDEAALLHRLEDCFAAYAALTGGDRDETKKVLRVLVAGMQTDLQRFSGPLTALADDAALEAYCFSAAGCVGEFWSKMLARHVPALAVLASDRLLERGIGLGNGLQLINILRDAPRDLANGRCYWPSTVLHTWGLELEDLIDPNERTKARPALRVLATRAVRLLDDAWDYIEAIPTKHARLRLAVIWPQWIGFATLARLIAAADPLDSRQTIKISRGDVYKLMAESTALVRSDTLLGWAHRQKRASVDL